MIDRCCYTCLFEFEEDGDEPCNRCVDFNEWVDEEHKK